LTVPGHRVPTKGPIMMAMTFWTGWLPSWRRSLAAVAVALFLGGSNYCLIVALSGAPMDCLAIATAKPTAGHCTGGSGGHCHRKSQGSRAPPMVAPCCMTAARVEAPQLAKTEALAPALGDEALKIVVLPPAPAHAVEPFTDESPPRLSRAPAVHAGRAPPLA
jgi:hypothetical protein